MTVALAFCMTIGYYSEIFEEIEDLLHKVNLKLVWLLIPYSWPIYIYKLI